MLPPPEFLRLAQRWHRDFFLDEIPDRPTELGVIATLLGHLARPEQLVVKQFLTELLRRNPDDAELQEMWQATSADWLFPDPRGLRKFLAMLRDTVE